MGGLAFIQDTMGNITAYTGFAQIVEWILQGGFATNSYLKLQMAYFIMNQVFQGMKPC